MRPRKPRSPCPACGKLVENLRSKYCSNTCQGAFEYRAYIARWQAGQETGNNGTQGVSPAIRRYLHEKYAGACTKCGWSKVNPVTGKVPLQIEHKDGNSMNTVESNLDLLCPNCHSLTPTYGILNRGKGRASRHKSSVGL